ncbi:hypothetical protein ACJMK2_006617 [Sinanodonta woodiana]|uniref:RING-type E3 ubiquitin transferase n=1 Tax=Sinanodonta woodiana TaxID=1069815 RepID=A0ABD3VVC5_SINWO
MAGIRVLMSKSLLDKLEINDLREMLKAHFEDRRYGGSDIKEMHFPILQNEAVIIYKDSSVVDGVMRTVHTIDGKKLCVRRLPMCQIYQRLHADLDPDMASIIQGCGMIDILQREIQLEMQYGKKKKTLIGFVGSWYQLEMAWNFIDSLMAQQERMLLENELHDSSYSDNIDGKGRHSRSFPSSVEDKSLSVLSLDQEPRRIQQRKEHRNSEEDLNGFAVKGVESETSPARQRKHEKKVGRAAYKETQHQELSSQQKEKRTKTEMMAEHDMPESLLLGEIKSDHLNASCAGKEDTSKSSICSGGNYAEPAQIQHKVEYDTLSNLPRTEGLNGKQETELDAGKNVEDAVGRMQTKQCLIDNMDESDGTPSLDLRGYGFAVMDHSLPGGVETNARHGDRTGNETFDYFASIKDESSVSKERIQNNGDGVTNSKSVPDLDDSTEQNGDSFMGQAFQREDSVIPFSTDLNVPQLEFTIGDINVVVLRGDITEEKSEGIVSPASINLDNRAGAAKVIAVAAGNELQKECKDFIKKHHFLDVTEVMHTSAGGRLNGKVTCVLHAAGPIWQEKSRNDETFQDELTTTYVNCFHLAEKRWLRSLSLPLISSGIFGGPIHLCVRSFIDGLLIFIINLGKKPHLQEIRLINIDLEGTQLTIVILQQLLEMGLNKLTREALTNFDKTHGKKPTTTKLKRSSSLPRSVKKAEVLTAMDKEAKTVPPSRGRSSSVSRKTNSNKVKETHSGLVTAATSTQTKSSSMATHAASRRSERDQDDNGSSYSRIERDGQSASAGRPFSPGLNLKSQKSSGSSSTGTRPTSSTGMTSGGSERDQGDSGSSFSTIERDGQSASAGRPFSPGPSLKGQKSSGSSSTRTRPTSSTGMTSGRSERDQDDNGSSFPLGTGRDGQSASGVRPLSAAPSMESQKRTGSSRSQTGPLEGGSVGQTKNPPQIKQSLFSQEPNATASKKKERGYLKKAKSQPLKAVHDSQDSDSNMESPRSPRGDNSDDSLVYPQAATSEKMFARRDLKPPENMFSSLPLDLEKLSHKSNSRTAATLPLGLSQRHVVERDMDTVCPICLELMHKPKSLPKCNHKFCSACIDKYFKTCKPVCPQCGYVYGVIKGDQPKGGKMTYKIDKDMTVPGYEDAEGAIIITYEIPGGKQEDHHPRPGHMYNGLYRSAYLPNCSEGRLVLKLLQRAFDAGLTFTIGESKTTGRDNTITWNDIHHKTSIHGGSTNFGYPDPTYLQRVQEELAAKGITKDMV